MRRLAKAIDGLAEPAVEKIAKDQQEDPFQVLIATMLSAQTRDAVTAAASARLFRVARTPRSMAKLTPAQIQTLIYPVSFYRLILAHSSQENICVDTHVHRISNRLGWVKTRTPEETEHALYRVARRRWWPIINLYLVTWGQNVCRPVYPLCPQCVLADVCPKVGVTRVGRPVNEQRSEAGGRRSEGRGRRSEAGGRRSE